MSWAEITNPYLKTRGQERDSNGNWVDVSKVIEKNHFKSRREYPSDLPEETVIFRTFGTKTILDHLVYMTNTNTFPRLELSGQPDPPDYNTQLFHGISATAGRFTLSPEYLDSMGNVDDYFEIVWKNETANMYFIKLKKPVEIPEGAMLSLRTIALYDESDPRLTYKAYWRTFE